MPSPNAAWRFSSPSMHDLVGPLEQLGIAVGGRERQQHPLVAPSSGSRGSRCPWRPCGPSSPARRPAAAPRWRSASARARRPAGAGRRRAWRGARCWIRSRSTSCRCRRSAAARSSHARARATASGRRARRRGGRRSGRPAVRRGGARSARRGTASSCSKPRLRSSGDRLTPSSASCTNPRNRSSSSTGKPEHAGDDVDGDVLGVLLGGVDDRLARRDLAHVVEALAAQLADLRLPRLDLLRRERRQQQPAGQGVERRIAGDRWGAADAGAASRSRDVLTTTERLVKLLGVVGDLAHELGGDRRPHPAVAVGVGDRAARLAQLRPDLRRPRVVGRVGVVEVGRPVVDGSVDARRALRIPRGWSRSRQSSSHPVRWRTRGSWPPRGGPSPPGRRRHLAVADDHGLAVVVDVEQLRCQGVAAVVALALLGVHPHLHVSRRTCIVAAYSSGAR